MRQHSKAKNRWGSPIDVTLEKEFFPSSAGPPVGT
jgi:hypothetical protein